MMETTIMLKDERDWPKIDIKDGNGKTMARGGAQLTSL
jgi:hypothetical protein